MSAISRTRALMSHPPTAAENSRHCLPCRETTAARDRLGHGELRKDLDELEGARHAALGQRHRPDPGNVLALEQHLALGRHQQAGEQIDQRGLAGAVGAHDRDELARATAMLTSSSARKAP